MGDKYREPSHSCPDIDDVQGKLRDYAKGLTRALEREPVDSLIGTIQSHADGMIETASDLEVVRKINEALREWGTAWCERAEEAEERVAELEKELAEAREVANA